MNSAFTYPQSKPSSEGVPSNVLSVSDLTSRVRSLLTERAEFSDLWVRGEVSNHRTHTSGHMYFDLKDANSMMRCVMFANSARRVRFKVDDGIRVRVRGRIDLYEPRGDIQINVSEMVPDGIGELFVALERLKKELAALGLFDEAVKRPIPQFPRRIGLVTSPTGAAVHDFLNIVMRRFPAVEILLVPVRVQGDGAEEEIAEALAILSEIDDVDVVVLARGGGSIEDLWAFNTEMVARAIRRSRAPVLSGIGHETDITIADMAADRRAPTPSAAAELVVPDIREVRNCLGAALRAIQTTALSRLSSVRARLDAKACSMGFRRPEMVLDPLRQRIDSLNDRAERALAASIRARRDALAAKMGVLAAMDPRAILSRGYSLTTDGAGRPVTGISRIDVGDDVRVIFSDGELLCTINEKRQRS